MDLTDTKTLNKQLDAMLRQPNKANSAIIAELAALLKQHPNYSRAHNELGVLYYQCGEKHKARDCFQAAVSLNSQYPRALTNLGACHNDLGDNTQAIACYEQALDIDPRMADAWGNLGKLYNENREYENAAYCYERALRLNRAARFVRGLASAYRLSGRLGRAMALFQEAISLEPNDAFSHTAVAAIHFYREQYPEALRAYEWRWQTQSMQEHQQKYPALFSKPAYRGESLRGKTLLVHTEQGYGDNLLFARYINSIKARADKLVLWCWPGLEGLFKHNFDVDLITSNSNALPHFDVQLPLLSIPYHLDPELAAMAQFAPYLSAPKPACPLGGLEPRKLNIGLVWSCDPKGFDYAYKKLSLSALEPLFSVANTRFFSLQLAPDRRELLASPFTDQIIDLAPQLTDFLATAQAIQQLDLVISVDTAVAHLAAAMGKPTWVLLKKNPDWRWHGYDGHPLWYPQARIFCQYPLDDWQNVVKRVGEELHNMAAQHA